MDKYLESFTSTTFYQNVLSNLLVVVIIALLVVGLARAGRQPIWAEAYRRIRRSKLALVALGIIGLYGLIAVADSIGWRENSNATRKTLIDRAFETRYKEGRERYYSAPFGRETFGEAQPRPLRYPGAHPLGTDGTGEDVLYLTMKGARTAFIVGGLTQILITPVALLAGMAAGYFGKRTDDIIQYIYGVLSSIPNILLLIALLLVLGRGLLSLCFALGVTSWVGLCRLIRGETLKHRDREYVRAARALGVSNTRILTRHILPNLLPLVIIQITLGVSGLILSETILSYLGIGIPPGTGSWGNMLDAARNELAREPIVWWNVTAAGTTVFILVLAFNLLGDALRDAVDPRLRSS